MVNFFGVFFIAALKLGFSRGNGCGDLQCNVTSWLEILEIFRHTVEIHEQHETFNGIVDQNATAFENATIENDGILGHNGTVFDNSTVDGILGQNATAFDNFTFDGTLEHNASAFETSTISNDDIMDHNATAFETSTISNDDIMNHNATAFENVTAEVTTPSSNNGTFNSSEEPPFELEWSEIYEWIDLVQRIMFAFIIIFQIFTVAFFFNQFSQAHSEFKAPYYVMLAVGMCTDILGHTSELAQYYFFPNVAGTEGYEALTYFLEFQIFHGAVFMVTMNVTFILERVTEIWYKHLYSRIWSKLGTTMILLLNIISPLGVVGYIIFQPECVYYYEGCEPQLKNIALILISFTFVAAISMAIFVYRLFHRRNSGIKKITDIDRAFIIESVIGLILLLIYQICMTIWTYVWQFGYRNWDFYKPLEDFAIFDYLTLHAIEIYVLITYPPFRNGVLKLFTFGYWKWNEVKDLGVPQIF